MRTAEPYSRGPSGRSADETPRGRSDDGGVRGRPIDSVTTHDSRARWPWAAAAALVVGNAVLHKPISDVCDALFARIGRGSYERVTLLTIAALSAGGALLLLARGGAALRRPRVVAALLGVAACTVAAQRWLLVSNVELVHLPQFGLFAALVLATGLGPLAAWSLATLAGVVDEAYQYLVIYAHVSGTYFDYNDIVLNAIGAAWAVILSATSSRGRRLRWRGWGGALLAVSGAALAISCWLAPPRVAASDAFPYWRPALERAATGFGYHVMSASEGLAALLLLWGLVALATRRERAWRAAGGVIAAALVAVTLGGCWRGVPPARPAGSANSVEHARGHSPAGVAPPVARRGSSPAAGTELIVTFWCGPPPAELTDARAAEIAAAGFNVIGAPCEGGVTTELNRHALDVAARHGLTVWIADPRVSQYYDLDPNWEALVAGAVADYADHQALGGYFLVDEPGAAKFGDLGQVVARLHAVDPRRMPYINLLPDFASSEALGTETYREHVERFMAIVHPPLLSFDYYPFKTDTDRDTFFDNLSVVRDVARAHGVPFMLVVQAMPHGPYRDPTEAEIAWQVNHALAFGARGISYFAYWTPVNVQGADRWRFRHGLVEDGQPTEHLFQAARINASARAIAGQLDGWRSIAVVDSQGRFGAPLPIGRLAGLAGGPVTAGLFSDGGSGLAVLLVNQDYRESTQVRLALGPGAPLPQAFDPATSRWHSVDDVSIALSPGAGTLLRWPS